MSAIPSDTDIDLGTVINSTIQEVWSATQPLDHLKALVDGGRQLAAAFIENGDRYAGILASDQMPADTTPYQAFIVTYYWAERAKSFLILWRDILFEQNKAVVLLEQEELDTTDVAALQVRSKEVITEAAAELEQFVEEQQSKIRKGRGGLKRHIDELHLQHNPWPVYREQILSLSEQFVQLLQQSENMLSTGIVFQQLQTLIEQTVGKAIDLVEHNRQTARNIIEHIQSNQQEKPGKLAVYLEDMEESLPAPDSLHSFIEQIETLSADLPEKSQVPVATDGGLLQYKEISFHKTVQQWLESEILPLIYEIWETLEINVNGLKMSLVNIRNRATLMSSEQNGGKLSDLSGADFSQPLHAYERKVETTVQNLTELQTLVISRLQQHFRLPVIYEPNRAFLPVPLQSTINQLRVNQNALVTSIQEWAVRQTQVVRRFQETVEREEALSTSEKVVRYLQKRTPAAAGSHYNSIFLTKGYIGESFWVGREEEIAHMKKLIGDWRLGYRGAVSLSGQRFSGKSLLGDLIANRFFPKTTIRLTPQSTITLGGRRLNTSYDLEEALSFIRKNTLNTPSLVWIDDLELWREPGIPLGRNVNALQRYIDQFGSHLFFMVSMSNWLQAHLDRFLEINKVFQTDINLDRMPLNDIREAIMIRHGATHKLLIDTKGREVSPQQFRKMTAKVYRQAHGNIGEALNLWAFSTQTLGEDRVSHHLGSLPELPDFVNPDNALLLTAVTLAKKANEYRLRKLFGPAFADHYRGVLQRLISIGLLNRNIDGWLSINDVAANDVARLLQRKHYIET